MTACILAVIVLSALSLLSIKFALAGAFGLAAIAIIFFKPFYGLIFYLVMLYIRPQDFIPAMERMRVMLVLAVVVLITFFIHKVIRREKIAFLATRQHILMFILLLIVPISDIVNGRFAESYDALNEFLTVFLLFFIIVNIADDYKKFRKVCWTLVILTVLISINGIIMYFRGTGLAGTMPIAGTRVIWIGIFGDPNDYALAINSFFPFILVGFFDKKISKPIKILLFAAGAISIATLFFTDSRGGFVAFIAIISVFAVKRWGIIKGFAVGTLFLVVVFALAPSRMGSLSPYEASAAGRVNAWIDGLVLLKAHPVLGVGYQNFPDYVRIAAHSAFIKCMAELGLIGYFFWMALLYTSFVDNMKVADGPKTSYSRYAGIIQLALIGFVGSAAFLSQTYMPTLYILIALTTLTANNKEVTRRFPRFLSISEIWKIGFLMGFSIIGYKVLAMVYI